MVLLKSDARNQEFSAPDFNLPGVDGQQYSLDSFSDKKALAVFFICNHCPYVQAIEDRLIALQRQFEDQSVQLVGICSNDAENYPDDSPAALKARSEEKDYRFPYLIDETQDVAKAYGAICTPDLYLFNQDRKLTYRGRLDDNWQEASKVTTQDFAVAINRILKDQEPLAEQYPSMGCSIKWK